MAGSCKRGDPPGALAQPSSEPARVAAHGASSAAEEQSPARDKRPARSTTICRSSAAATKLASIAWRTWIYTDTGPKRTRYGYLRAGAIVDARGPQIVNEGCDGGWYRVNPRGFVCVGPGRHDDLERSGRASRRSVRPVRGQGLPYMYAMSSDTPPLLYFRLPTRSGDERVGG